MNIHKHSSVQDPLKVIKDVKRALQDQEGCRVDLLNLFLFCELFYLLQISFFLSQTIVSYWLCILIAKCPMTLRFACGWGLFMSVDGSQQGSDVNANKERNNMHVLILDYWRSWYFENDWRCQYLFNLFKKMCFSHLCRSLCLNLVSFSLWELINQIMIDLISFSFNLNPFGWVGVWRPEASISFTLLNGSLLLMLSIHGIVQIFGVLDVERVAGNFHISMHGLSNYVAQQVLLVTLANLIFLRA